MNNLLRAIRGGLHFDVPDTDLRALFDGVKEVRAQDTKAADQFYETLEGVVMELRVVTMDNRDAEAFLKPVSRTEVQDYFEVISHPMDLQTMLKKVKAKSYKSKNEFRDDLDLIWDNCFKYNSTPDHPLRACATRLKAKAQILLSRVTDRVERQTPKLSLTLGSLPSPPSSNEDHADSTLNSGINGKPLINGKLKFSMNGKGLGKPKSKEKDRHPLPIKIPPPGVRAKSSSVSSSRPPSQPLSQVPSHSPAKLGSTRQSPSPQTPGSSLSFPERAALLRTPESMATFMELDNQLDEILMSPDIASTSRLGLVTMSDHNKARSGWQSRQSLLPAKPLDPLSWDISMRRSTQSPASGVTTVPGPFSPHHTLSSFTNVGLVPSLTKRLKILAEDSAREAEHGWAGFSSSTNAAQKASSTPSSSTINGISSLQSYSREQSQDSGPLKRKRSSSPIPGFGLPEEDSSSRKKVKLEPGTYGTLSSLTMAKSASSGSATGNVDDATSPATNPLDLVLDLWWSAVSSNSLLASGVPRLKQPQPFSGLKDAMVPSDGKSRTKESGRAPSRSISKSPTKSRKKRRIQRVEKEKSLLNLMNANITTLHKLRSTHSKYSKLTRDQEQKEGTVDSSDLGSVVGMGGSTSSLLQPPENNNISDVEALPGVQEEENAEKIAARERPWKVRSDVGEEEAVECYKWMCSKVLEHSTFQGTSTLALNHLTDLAIQYISNVGSTLRLLCDKYSQKMSAEEIILHTLFENGVPSVSDLEFYIKDDIVRHGARLQDSEKKLNSALQEIVNAEVVDDDVMFGEDADEDNFASGMFGDFLGEDYLGLEASGVLSEIGMPNLNIPKRLWKGKKGGDATSGKGREKGEPQLPYPPPPPFVLLTSSKIDNQIGLLQNYYRDRFTALAALPETANSALSSMPPPGATLIPHISVQPPPSSPNVLGTEVLPPTTLTMLAPPGAPVPAPLPSGNPIPLPDDIPDIAHTKIGPIGQILLANPNSASMKKKVKKEGPPVTEKGSNPAGLKPGQGNAGNSSKKAPGSKESQDRDGQPLTPTQPPKKKKSATSSSVSGNTGPGATGKKVSPGGGSGKTTKGTGPPQPKNGPALVPPV